MSVLGCSQLTYVEAVASQKKEDFIQCIENALWYYGGVPEVIILSIISGSEPLKQSIPI